MDKKRRNTTDRIVLLVLAVTVAVLLSFMLKRFCLNAEETFSPELNVVDNPMMGFAPYAEDIAKCDQSNLVFIKLKWSDWEPEKGRYDTDFLESRYHLSRWKAAGKHGILRFVCDEPGEEGHCDIPQWLLEETGDGTFYDGESGGGYCPNYENGLLIDRHSKAIAALADFFRQDDFLAYVELGSLGFWGEWHCRDSSGASMMPSADTCWDYVLPYADRFQNVRFLMRRSYVQAVESGMGLYNDVVGDKPQTDRWLNWTVEGGSQDTTGEALPILPYPAFWETGPVGGELTSAAEPERLLGEELSQLLAQIQQSHMTFIGPHCPDRETYETASDAILRRLGYRYYVSGLSTAFSFAENALVLQLDWENAGAAPLYWDWPVTVKIFDAGMNPIYWEMLDLKLSQLAPGQKITTTTKIPYLESLRDGFSVGISVTSYDGNDRLKLAMDAEPLEDCQILYTFAQE